MSWNGSYNPHAAGVCRCKERLRFQDTTVNSSGGINDMDLEKENDQKENAKFSSPTPAKPCSKRRQNSISHRSISDRNDNLI